MAGADKIAQQVLGTIEKLLAGGTAEKLVFRRFPGGKLIKALSTGTKISDKDIDTVILRVNPEQISVSKKKIINKVQTSSPGRFVVFDWGTDLAIFNISGNTGNLLPDNITRGDPLSTFFNDVAAQADSFSSESSVSNIEARTKVQGINAVGTGIASPFINNMMMGTMSYIELLNMSPKYIVFKKLEKLFELADADRDVLTMEVGDYGIYRGYFEDFSFDIDAGTPWNWKYKVTFVVLEDLISPTRRMDDEYPESSFVE